MAWSAGVTAELQVGRIRLTVERFCATGTVVALVPVWLYPWFATQDGPSHLYNAMVLARSGDPSHVATHAMFEPVFAIFPNWISHILLAVFGRVFTPFAAMKIVVSLCVASISAATLYLQKSFKSTADPTALVGVMLGFSYLLFMGFFNFVLGCAMFGWSVGFAWRHRQEPLFIRLYLLLTLTFFTHGLAFAATVSILGLLSVVERRWRSLVMLLPAICAVVVEAWPRAHGHRGYQNLGWHLRRLVALDPFAYFRAIHANIASAMTLLLVLAVVLTLWRSRRWQPILVSAALLALFFVAPWAYSAGPSQLSWINDRFLMLFVMTLPAWLDLPRPRLVLAILGIMATLHVAATWRDVAALSSDIESIVQCRSAMPEHTALDVIGDPPSVVTKLQPLRHAPALLAVDRDIAYLPNYEARLDDFPIRFRSPAPDVRAEYALVWHGARLTGTVVCEGRGFRVVRR